MTIASSLAYFVLAGLAEIGGGYLIWLWLREGRSAWWALGGALVLIAYGFHSHAPAGALRARLRRIWRCLYCFVFALGLVGR